MIIECSSEYGVRLAEPFDFRRFKLVLTGDAVAEPRSWRGIIFIDDHNALVPIDLVLELLDRPADGTWQPAYAEMVAKARERGWIDIPSNAVRAHAERELKRAPTRGA
jgi:hypothetical protein